MATWTVMTRPHVTVVTWTSIAWVVFMMVAITAVRRGWMTVTTSAIVVITVFVIVVVVIVVVAGRQCRTAGCDQGIAEKFLQLHQCFLSSLHGIPAMG